MDSEVALLVGLFAGIAIGGFAVYFITSRNQKIIISRNTSGQIESIIQS